MQNLKIAKNTFYQTASRGISTGIFILLSVILVRFAGLNAYGDFSIAIAFVMIFVSLSEFGSTTTILKEFSNKDYLRKYFYTYLIYRVIIAVISFFLFYIFLAFSGYRYEIQVLLFAGSPLILLNSFSRAFFLLFQAKKDFKHQFISSFISGSVLCASLLVIYVTTGTISSLLSITLLVTSSALTLGYLFRFYRNDFEWGGFKGYSYLFILFKDSWVIGLTLLINMLMVNIDRVIMSKFLPSEDIGIYSLEYKIFEIALIIPTYIMNIYYPILLDKMASKDEYNRAFLAAIKKFTFIGIGVSIIMYILSSVIVIVWGASSQPSVEVLRILSIGTVFFYISSPISWYLVGEGKRSYLLFVYFVGLIGNTLLNLIYIQQYGYLAAAYITGISELLIVIMLIAGLVKLRQNMTKIG